MEISAWDCSACREAISADVDGEVADITDASLTPHLARRASCRAFANHVSMLRTTARTYRIDPPPESSRALMQSLERRRARMLTMPVRIGLVAVALVQLALAVPGFLGSDEGAPIHVAHEAGSWSLALAVGFLFAAWRPLRAVGMLPFVAALSAGLILTASLDLLHGRALPIDESSHLLELIGTGLLWLLVHPRVRRELAIA
jgi:predicted anti-sigma-YlaC factor YlaD